MYFSDEQAWRVLEKAGGKVRVLNDHAASGELIEGKPIMWKSGEGFCGPAIVHVIANSKEGRWVLVWHEEHPRWIHESNVIQQIV